MAPGNGSTTAESNQFLKLEQYLFQTLTAQDRIKLKLLSPVGIAEAVIAHRVDATAAAQRIIAKDVSNIACKAHAKPVKDSNVGGDCLFMHL